MIPRNDSGSCKLGRRCTSVHVDVVVGAAEWDHRWGGEGHSKSDHGADSQLVVFVVWRWRKPVGGVEGVEGEEEDVIYLRPSVKDGRLK